MHEPADLFLFAETLADRARVLALQHFRQSPPVEDKAASGERFNPVTAADRAIESDWRAAIAARFPDHGVLGEEEAERPGAGPWRWVLDPIDGTSAFLTGLPTWGCLIGLYRDGAPYLGIIELPYVAERYSGAAGQARVRDRLGERALAVSGCTRLSQARLSTTDPGLFSQGERAAWDMLRRTARLTRMGLDCAAYAALAAGGLDLVVESGLKPYDIAACIPGVEGAGGFVRDWQGGPAMHGGRVVAAASMALLEEALSVLRRIPPGL